MEAMIQAYILALQERRIGHWLYYREAINRMLLGRVA
jgi:hypothetical protein